MAYTTIDDPSAYFQSTIYTGSGSDDLVVTNVGNSDLQPDFIWIKSRSIIGQHVLSDTSRGILKVLNSNSYAAEDSNSEGEMIKSVQSDGFTLGDSAAGQGDTNSTSSATYVAWQWLANGGSRTTNAEVGDNPAGGYQANTTAGFSIVDYTGTGAAGTMAHGLGAVPKVIMVKNRSAATDWMVYHASNTAAPETDNLTLNETSATADASTMWNDTAPTSTVFSLGTHDRTNDDSETLVAYLWTDIQGYSKFGGYIGNGAQDGTFVYTGFKPAFIIAKRTDAVKNWYLADSTRSPNNIITKWIMPHSNAAENTSGDATDAYFDILSNGFKMRQDFSHLNADGAAHIYMAFAEQPFVTSGGVPCTAF